MILTGKTKEQFEKWYLNYIRTERKDYDGYSDDTVLGKFYRETLSMQIGVYQLFFDSVNVHFEIYTFESKDNWWVDFGNITLEGIDSRQEDSDLTGYGLKMIVR